MSFFDWVLFLFSAGLVLAGALHARRYQHGVADFLSAGRVANRYVLCVAGGEAAFGLITLVGMLEADFNSGYAYGFWSSLLTPVGLMLSLFGFCNYRFRETRAMTMGQFFEIRYNRPFRIAACFVQICYGVLNYAIFPAVGARFIIYYLDLPLCVTILGCSCSTFAFVMLVILGAACLIACAGGQVTIMVTDCIQGILNYPMSLCIVAFLLWKFTWGEDMLPALLARPAGESFINPFDIGNLRDFNLFYVFSGIIGMFLFRLSWGGRAYDSAAKNAHEAKMGGLLGTWRGGFNAMLYMLLAIVAIAVLNRPRCADVAATSRAYLAEKTLTDVVKDARERSFSAERSALPAVYRAIPPRTQFSASYADRDAYAAETSDPYLQATSDALGGSLTPDEMSALSPDEQIGYNIARKQNQTFSSIYAQMRVPVIIRHILPTGLVGLFFAIAFFLMLSTDTTYLHAWASTIVQDFLLPLRNRPWTPVRQIRYLRMAIVGVALFAFTFSFYFGQVDYVFMFFAITGAIWSASGPVITLGLYWKRGTTAAAFISLFIGASTAIGAIFAQKVWVSTLYPAIVNAGLATAADGFLRTVSSPFHPYISWSLTPDKFPLNSAEVGFLVNLFTLLLYIVASLATCRAPFNMERMLHRGKWGDPAEPPRSAVRVSILQRLLGIDADYTRGDRVLAWSVFLWSFGWSFCLCFLGNVIWHAVSHQPESWWGHYFFVTSICMSCLIGIVSTVWFGVCSTRDLFRLFRDLAARDASDFNTLDDGRVEGHVNLADAAQFAGKGADASQGKE